MNRALINNRRRERPAKSSSSSNDGPSGSTVFGATTGVNRDNLQDNTDVNDHDKDEKGNASSLFSFNFSVEPSKPSVSFASMKQESDPTTSKAEVELLQSVIPFSERCRFSSPLSPSGLSFSEILAHGNVLPSALPGIHVFFATNPFTSSTLPKPKSKKSKAKARAKAKKEQAKNGETSGKSDTTGNLSVTTTSLESASIPSLTFNSTDVDYNYDDSTCPSISANQRNRVPSWVIGVNPLSADDFGDFDPAELPDVSVDPETRLLSLINSHSKLPKSYYITLSYPFLAFDKDLQIFSSALSLHATTCTEETNGDGVQNELLDSLSSSVSSLSSTSDVDASFKAQIEQIGGYSSTSASTVTTFVVIVPPITVVDLCYVFKVSPKWDSQHSVQMLPSMFASTLAKQLLKNTRTVTTLTKTHDTSSVSGVSGISGVPDVSSSPASLSLPFLGSRFTLTSLSQARLSEMRRVEGRTATSSFSSLSSISSLGDTYLVDAGTVETSVGRPLTITLDHLEAEDSLDLEHLGRCLSSDVTVLGARAVVSFPRPLPVHVSDALQAKMIHNTHASNTLSEIAEEENTPENLEKDTSSSISQTYSPSVIEADGSALLLRHSCHSHTLSPVAELSKWSTLSRPSSYNLRCLRRDFLLATSLLQESSDLTGSPAVPLLPSPFYSPGTFLCTQGFAGGLTHFLPQTRHAVDLRCPPRSPLVAVAAGTVVSVRSDARVAGCHSSNLFSWNSLMIKIAAKDLQFFTARSFAHTALISMSSSLSSSLTTHDELTCQILADTLLEQFPISESTSKSISLPTGCDFYYVEYVHLAPESITVKPGDIVRPGQVIALSGAAGFCPEPHVHIQVTSSDADDAFTVPFVLSAQAQSSNNKKENEKEASPVTCYVPFAGTFFNATGSVASEHARKEVAFTNLIASSIQSALEYANEMEAKEEEVVPETNSANTIEKEKEKGNVVDGKLPLECTPVSNIPKPTYNLLKVHADTTSGSNTTPEMTNKSLGGMGANSNPNSNPYRNSALEALSLSNIATSSAASRSSGIKKMLKKKAPASKSISKAAVAAQAVLSTQKHLINPLLDAMQLTVNDISEALTIPETDVKPNTFTLTGLDTLIHDAMLSLGSDDHTVVRPLVASTVNHDINASDAMMVYTPFTSYSIAGIIAQYCGDLSNL